MTEYEIQMLLDAATLLRTVSRYHNDEFQRARDSVSEVVQHKARMALERAIQLNRMANEVDTVARTNGLKDG